MAELLNVILIKKELYMVNDVSGITQNGIYNLRASADVQAGVMIVINFQNTVTQIVLGLNYNNEYIKKMRCTRSWSTNFFDWIDF